MNLQERIEFNKKQLTDTIVSKIDISNLRYVKSIDFFNYMFCDLDIFKEWLEDTLEIESLKEHDNYGGINYGDGRLIYYIIKYLRAKSVLEIGTHIGTSTIHIVSALKKEDAKIITVDIKDVNSNEARWKELELSKNPKQRTDSIKPNSVEYITMDSIEYLKKCKDKFDIIFLDGLHTSKRVCEELELAIPKLNNGGIIILHDYYPDIRPLFEERDPISGPFMGVEHFKSVNNIKVFTFSPLSWSTNGKSNNSSIAVVCR